MNEIVPFIGIFLFYKKLRKVDRAKSIRLRLPGVILSALLCPKGKKGSRTFSTEIPNGTSCHSILVILGFRQAQDDTVEKAPQTESRADFAQDDSAEFGLPYFLVSAYRNIAYIKKLILILISVFRNPCRPKSDQIDLHLQYATIYCFLLYS